MEWIISKIAFIFRRVINRLMFKVWSFKVHATFELKFLFPLYLSHLSYTTKAMEPIESNGKFRITSIGQTMRVSLSALEELNSSDESDLERRDRAVSRTTRLFPRAFLRGTKITLSFLRRGVVQADVTNGPNERWLWLAPRTCGISINVLNLSKAKQEQV